LESFQSTLDLGVDLDGSLRGREKSSLGTLASSTEMVKGTGVRRWKGNLTELLETCTGERSVEVDTLEEGVDLDGSLRSRGKSSLGTLASRDDEGHRG